MSFITTWNEFASRALAGAWMAGIAATIAAVVVALTWRCVRRWSSAHVGYALFLIPLALLFVPLPDLGPRAPLRVAAIDHMWPALVGRDAGGHRPLNSPAANHGQAPASTGGAPAVDPEPAGTAAGSSTASAGSGVSTGPGPSAGPGTEPASAPAVQVVALSPAGWLLLGWVLVVGSLITGFVRNQARTQAMVRRARDLEVDSLPPGVREAVRPLVRGGVRLAESDELTSPAAWGVWRPTLVMPSGLTRDLAPGELRWVLCHELAHVGRRDVAVASVQRIVQILWFFHPVVWFVGRQVDRLRECACDEAALARCRAGSRRSFAEALVRLAARPELEPVSTLPVQGLLGPKSLLETRILRMLDPKRPVRGGLGLLSAPVLLLAGASSVALAASVAQDVPEVTAQDRPWEKDVTEKPRPKVQTDELTPAVASTESRWRAITAGLAYLEGAQSDDGGWWPGLIEIGADESVDGVARYKSVEWSGEFNRTGVTALAVLAFCEADQAQRPAVKKAIDYLLSVQGEEGCIGTRDQFLHIPSHLAATLAVLRYHESHPDEKLLACAQQGMGYIARSRNPYSGWRYSSPPDGDNDTFITSLALRALVAGRAAGLEVDEQAFVGGMSWIEEMTNFNTGRCGYNERGGPVSRLQITRESHPVEWTEMLTSMAILARLDMGQKPLEQKAIREGALLVANTPPLWDERRGSIDYYHWAFGTDALQRLGGFHYTHWLERLDTALIPHQEEDGSWRPIDAWSTNGARIHATAVNTWTLAMSARK